DRILLCDPALERHATRTGNLEAVAIRSRFAGLGREPAMSTMERNELFHVIGEGHRMATLLDDLVSPQQERLRNCPAESLGGRAVNNELELRVLLNRQVGWFRAPQDLVDIACPKPVHVRKAYSVKHQAAGIHVFAKWIHGWQPIF